MRQMIFGISSLVCVVTAVLWLRNCWVQDTVTYSSRVIEDGTQFSRSLSVYSGGGQLYLLANWARGPDPNAGRPAFARLSPRRSEWRWWRKPNTGTRYLGGGGEGWEGTLAAA